MPEYRYIGASVTGKPVQGIIFGQDKKQVQQKLKRLIHKKGIRIDAVQERAVYAYKIQKGVEKPFRGEQKAFSKEELESALRKMGYKVHYVRKKFVGLQRRVPRNDVILFIRICADLLREKFPYDEILTMISNDTENKKLRETIRDIQKDLKEGYEGHMVYAKHQDVFGKYPAHMLAVASTSGNMAAIYENTAKFMERDAEFRKNLRTVFFMPVVVTLALLASVGFYVMYLFPKMTEFLEKYKIDIPPMTKATMQFSEFLQSHYLLVLVLFGLPALLFWNWIRTERGRYQFDRLLIRLPMLGPILHKISIEIFCRVFYALYSSSGENVNAIRVAAESCRNRFIEKQITTLVIPRMLKEGRSFVECLARTTCFTLNAVKRLKTGEESGTLRESALHLANYYEKETSHKMKRFVDIVNILISTVVTILIIGLTIISSEIGFVSPPTPFAK